MRNTQHTRGPRCEKAVDRRHHNFSYERPEALPNPNKLCGHRLGQHFYNLARGAQDIYRENRQPARSQARNTGSVRRKPRSIGHSCDQNDASNPRAHAAWRSKPMPSTVVVGDGKTYTTRQEAEGAMRTVKVCESGGTAGGPVACSGPTSRATSNLRRHSRICGTQR
jgi:hypothetical protein